MQKNSQYAENDFNKLQLLNYGQLDKLCIENNCNFQDFLKNNKSHSYT